MKKFYYTSILFVVLAVASCDSYLDIAPKDRVIPETLEDYRKLLTSGYQSFPRTKSKTAVRTDEMTLNENDFSASAYKDIFLWKDTGYDEETSEFDYELLYRTIFYSNEVISGTQDMATSEAKNQLVGEAYALRAYTYFELINLFSKPYTTSAERGVPLVLDIDMENYQAPATLAEIYNLIWNDIAQAESLINIQTQPANLKYRFSKTSLLAFKARVYLYQKDYEKSLDAVNALLAIHSTLLDLNNNTENILPQQINSPENIQALDYAINNVVNNMAIVSDELIALYDQNSDLRFPLYYEQNGANYKTVKGNSNNHICSFRTGELLLIKAENLYQLGRESDAKNAVLELAKSRYNATGLATYTTKINALSGNEFWEELMNERFRETAFEGYRWFDLRRNNQKSISHTFGAVTEVLQPNDPRYTIAFPRSAQRQNPNLAN